MGLTGLASAWMHLAAGSLDAALLLLRQACRLGSDLHQHHFIDTYIGLTLFCRGELVAAAGQWRDSMHNALLLGHIRGAAGSIEGCGYIAARSGEASLACRLLGSAAKIRRRTGIPLYNFWVPHNLRAHESVKNSLGAEDYAAFIHAGERMREEDAANEAAKWLHRFAGSRAGRTRPLI